MHQMMDAPLLVQVERSRSSTDPAGGVAREDGLAESAARTGQPHIRLWYNAPCIVLGRGYARRLPRPVSSVRNLPVLARSSGGQVVIHGPGVLNLSVAVPTSVWDGTIHQVFGGLSQAVAEGLRLGDWQAAVGEVPGSYCPGDHDVAVDGSKVMGISQRRTREALLVHGSLNVAVDPAEYAAVLNSFYHAAGLEDQADPSLIGTLYTPPATSHQKERLEELLLTQLLHNWSKLTGIDWTASGV